MSRGWYDGVLLDLALLVFCPLCNSLGLPFTYRTPIVPLAVQRRRGNGGRRRIRDTLVSRISRRVQAHAPFPSSSIMVNTMSSHASDTTDSEPEDLLSTWLDQLSLSRQSRQSRHVKSNGSDDGTIGSLDSLSTVTEAQAMTAESLNGERPYSTPAQKLRFLQALLIEFRTSLLYDHLLHTY